MTEAPLYTTETEESSLDKTASERRGNNMKSSQGLLPENQGQNLALTVLHVPYSLDSEMTIAWLLLPCRDIRIILG